MIRLSRRVTKAESLQEASPVYNRRTCCDLISRRGRCALGAGDKGLAAICKRAEGCGPLWYRLLCSVSSSQAIAAQSTRHTPRRMAGASTAPRKVNVSFQCKHAHFQRSVQFMQTCRRPESLASKMVTFPEKQKASDPYQGDGYRLHDKPIIARQTNSELLDASHGQLATSPSPRT